MKKNELNQKTLLATKDLLIDIIKNPTEYKSNTMLLKTLKSQRNLANAEDETRGIFPCSLNTLKSCAESLLSGGFLELDGLRINARNALESSMVGSKANSKTRTGLTHRVKELEAQIEVVEKSNFLLTSLVDEMRDALKEMAFKTCDNKIISDYQDLNKRIEAKLSYTLDGVAW